MRNLSQGKNRFLERQVRSLLYPKDVCVIDLKIQNMCVLSDFYFRSYDTVLHPTSSLQVGQILKGTYMTPYTAIGSARGHMSGKVKKVQKTPFFLLESRDLRLLKNSPGMRSSLRSRIRSSL